MLNTAICSPLLLNPVRRAVKIQARDHAAGVKDQERGYLFRNRGDDSFMNADMQGFDGSENSITRFSGIIERDQRTS